MLENKVFNCTVCFKLLCFIISHVYEWELGPTQSNTRYLNTMISLCNYNKYTEVLIDLKLTFSHTKKLMYKRSLD